MAWCALSDAQRYIETTKLTTQPTRNGKTQSHTTRCHVIITDVDGVSRTCETRTVKRHLLFQSNQAQHRHLLFEQDGSTLYDV